MHSQGTEVPGEYPGKPIRIHKTSTNFLLLSVNPGYKYYICSFLSHSSVLTEFLFSLPHLLYPLASCSLNAAQNPQSSSSDPHELLQHWSLKHTLSRHCSVYTEYFSCSTVDSCAKAEQNIAVWSAESTLLCVFFLNLLFTNLGFILFKNSLFLDFLVIFAFYFQ